MQGFNNPFLFLQILKRSEDLKTCPEDLPEDPLKRPKDLKTCQEDLPQGEEDTLADSFISSARKRLGGEF